MSQTHLDDQLIQRALHRELTPGEEQPVKQHLETCSACRARLDQAEQEEVWLGERFQALDHPRPHVTAEGIMARGRGRSRARMAAGIVLALAGAGVAYAAPGSPLPELLGRLVAPSAPATDRTILAPAAPAAEPAGIAVLPGERLTIELSSGLRDTAVVALHEGNEVVVKSSSGETSFEAGPERLLVRRSEVPGKVDILIPRAARWVEIRAGKRVVFLKQGSRTVTRAAADSSGRYLIPLLLAP
jgi:hypothetical protein